MDEEIQSSTSSPSERAQTSSPRCPACDAEVGQAKFCPECGTSVGQPRPTCPSCGHQPEGAPKFCPECGTEIC